MFSLFALALDRAFRGRLGFGAEGWFGAAIVLVPAGWLIVGDPADSGAVVGGIGLAVLAVASGAVWSLRMAPGRAGPLRREAAEITALLLSLALPFVLFANDVISWNVCIGLAAVASVGLPMLLRHLRGRTDSARTASAGHPPLDADRAVSLHDERERSIGEAMRDNLADPEGPSLARRRGIAAILILVTPLAIGPVFAVVALILTMAFGWSVDVLPWAAGVLASLWMAFIGWMRRWSARPIVAAAVPTVLLSLGGISGVAIAVLVPLVVMLAGPLRDKQDGDHDSPAPSEGSPSRGS